MIVRRCPKCGVISNYPHGATDPHKCTHGQWPAVKPGWSEERRAAQRAKMNEWHRKQAEARAAARAKVELETFNIAKTDT